MANQELDGAFGDAGIEGVEVVVECKDAAGHEEGVAELEIGECFPAGVAAVDVAERVGSFAEVARLEIGGAAGDDVKEAQIRKELAHVGFEDGAIAVAGAGDVAVLHGFKKIDGVKRLTGRAESGEGDGGEAVVDADFEHAAGDAAAGEQLVVGHEQERRVEGEPALDAMEGVEIIEQEAAPQRGGLHGHEGQAEGRERHSGQGQMRRR